MNPELLSELEECERLLAKLKAELNALADDAKTCMDGELLAIYLRGIEEAEAFAMKTMRKLVVLREGRESAP